MRKIIFYIIPAIIIAIFLVVFFSPRSVDYAEVKGKVRDELCGDAVWGVKIVIDGKYITRYVSETYRLTEIEPRLHTLVATAPNYYEFKRDIQVERGSNVVDIYMRGKEIPDLKKIDIFTKPVDEGLQLEIWFINSEGEPVEHYPCLPLSLEGKLFLDIGRKKSEKGRKIFEGPIELFWDSETNLGKNKAIIPWDKIDVDRESKEEKKVIIVKEYGILEITLHTPQGDFKHTTDSVRFFQYPESS